MKHVRQALIWLNDKTTRRFADTSPLAVLSLACSLCLVTGTGPFVQSHVLPLLNADTLSIYGAVYGQAFSRFPSLGEFLVGSILSPFAVSGFFIAIVGVRTTHPHSILVSLLVWTFVFFIAIDTVFWLFFRDSVGLDEIIQTAISNLVGALFVAFLVVLILLVCDTFFTHFRSRFGRVAIAAIPIASGAIVSVGIYYVADYLFRSLPVRVELLLDDPSEGVLVADTRRIGPDPEGEDAVPFTFVAGLDDATATIRSSSQSLYAAWSALATEPRFDITATLYAGCTNATLALREPQPSVALLRRDVRSLKVSFDGGGLELSLMEGAGYAGRFGLVHDLYSSFSTDRLQDGAIEITQYLGSPTLSFTGRGSLVLFSSAFLIDYVDEEARAKERTLRLDIDGDVSVVHFSPATGMLSSGTTDCQTIATEEAIDSGHAALPSDVGLIVGAMVRIEERPSDTIQLETSELRLWPHESGWIKVRGNPEGVGTNESAGRVGMFSVGPGVHTIDLDGQPEPFRPTDHLTAFGDFDATFARGGILRFSGTAYAMWKNSVRASPTKWELASWEWRTLLAGVIVSLMAALARLLFTRLRSNEEFCWLSNS